MRIAQEKDIGRLVAEGYKGLDTHLHSSASYDVLPVHATKPSTLAERQFARGAGYFTLTDHDSMRGIESLMQEKPTPDPRIVPGVEIKIKPANIDGNPNTHTLHVNVYGLNRQQFIDLEHLARREQDFYGFIDYLQKERLPHTLNHPTWSEFGEKPDWSLLPTIMRCFDVIEAYNHTRTPEQNGLTMRIAMEQGKGVVSSSDNHQGKPYIGNFAMGSDFMESWEYIKAGESIIIPKSADSSLFMHEIRTWIGQARELKLEDARRKEYRMNTGSEFWDNVMHFLANNPVAFRSIVRGPALVALEAFTELFGERLAEKKYVASQRRAAAEIAMRIDKVPCTAPETLASYAA